MFSVIVRMCVKFWFTQTYFKGISSSSLKQKIAFRRDSVDAVQYFSTSKLVWTESANFKFDPLWMDWVKVKIKR